MNEEIGDLENELGFIVSEIEDLEDQLSALREQKIRVESELANERVQTGQTTNE